MTEGTYTREEVSEMSDRALAKAWVLTVEGRQYDGVESDRKVIGNEMAFRLESSGD